MSDAPQNAYKGDRQSLTLRLPRSLHAHLNTIAAEQDTPLTTILVLLLASGSGWRGVGEPTPDEMRQAAKTLKRLADQRATEEGPLVA